MELGTLLLGIFIGSASNYLAVKYTDVRRSREIKSKYKRVKAKMPKLFAILKNNDMRCNIAIVADEDEFQNSSYCLIIKESSVEDIYKKIRILRNYGYLKLKKRTHAGQQSFSISDDDGKIVFVAMCSKGFPVENYDWHTPVGALSAATEGRLYSITPEFMELLEEKNMGILGFVKDFF